jgi:outer membrane lipoprotein-sorting protein
VSCERTQAALSAAMDGEAVTGRQRELAAAHVATCATCARFADRTGRIRTAVRIRPAEPVPDLVEPIMRSIALERARSTARRRARLRGVEPLRRRRGWILRPTGLVAATVVGALVGSLLVGGPWQRPSSGPIAAAAVARSIRGSASSVDSFRGTYAIRETGLAPAVPERRLTMDVAFLAPQRFRLEVHDETPYPDASWTPTNLTWIQDVASTYSSGPSGCPEDLVSQGCPRTRATVTKISRFSATAPLPADLVLPLATFGSTRGLRVEGEEDIHGHRTVRVELSFERASPLFPFLRMGGTWRPFFAEDRVVLWLDAATWFPVRTQVFPASGRDRRAWEMRFGRATESPDAPILEVDALSTSTVPPDASLFAFPGSPGPASSSLGDLSDRLGYRPATPQDPGDLQLATVIAPNPATPATPRSLLLYADGLDYLRVGERPDWRERAPFGPVDATAQRVAVGGGVAYYEPAGDQLGRRLAIHASATDLYVETNLPRSRLLSIASSIPLRGRPFPRDWQVDSSRTIRVERAIPQRAAAIAGVTLPSRLPEGYVVASAEVQRVGNRPEGATFHLRQRDSDAAGGPVSLHVALRAALPPASAGQLRVRLGSFHARWTPARSELEWIQAGSYRSLVGPVALRVLAALARSVAEGRAT